MSREEDVLQDNLARLEADESVENCRADLPDDEAALLETAAMLRRLPYPNRVAGTVTMQRAGLLRAAREHSQTRSRSTTPHTLQPDRSPWSRLIAIPRPIGLALACALVIFAVAGALVLRSVPQPQTAHVAPSTPSFAVFLPAVQSAITAPDPHTAVVGDARGLVEVQTGDGLWKAAAIRQTVTAGQRIRAGQLSNATLYFHDGSRARLGPMSELSIDELAALTDGPRVVKLTQWIGESDHDVTKSTDAASRYEVRTPTGTGIAKGTSFHVSVSASRVTRISVDEGTVAATGLNVTVIVVAGQVTTIRAGAPPESPVFRVSGEGIVTQMGETWRIGGLEFRTTADTVSIGNPQIGDRVSVEGHLLTDGTRVADLIVLLRRAPENRFAFTGRVDSIGDTAWTISGRTISVTAETDIATGIKVGDLVEVEGVVRPDGTLFAEHIRRADVEAGLPFEFIGVVGNIGSESWTISGISITVSADTAIGAGIAAGDVVKVEGRILGDGTWLAQSIERAEPAEREFRFTGTVQGTDPWVVSGISFETDAQTEIEAGIQVGDRVEVKGRVLDDGTWLAEEIEKPDDTSQRFEFVGRVTHTDPWIVGGIGISVTAETRIDNGIAVGDLVRVSGRILPDGTLLAESIRQLNIAPMCLDTRAIVIRIDGDQIELSDGQVVRLTGDTKIQTKDNGKVKVKDDGRIDAGSVVIAHVCIGQDGTPIVVIITIIHRIGPKPPDVHPPRTDLCINPAGKVMPCPPGNPPPFRHDDQDDNDGGKHGDKENRHDD